MNPSWVLRSVSIRIVIYTKETSNHGLHCIRPNPITLKRLSSRDPILPSYWTTHGLTHNVRAWKGLALQKRLTKTLHMSENRLAKVPAEELVRGSKRISQKLLAELAAGDLTFSEIRCEAHDLVVVLPNY